jgi:hypothetical protein
MTEARDRGAARLLLALYFANSFLFLVLSFYFLPDPIVKVVGSAGAVFVGLLGLKSLNPREADTMSFVTRHRGLVIVALSLIAMLQTVLLAFGVAYPCKIKAIPGSTVMVDGKFYARTPDPTPEERAKTAEKGSPHNIRPWLKPRTKKYWLRWDTHEIRISKKWYVDDDGSDESVKNVWVKLLKLWKPKQAFSSWAIKIKQKPVFKISYGFKEIEDQPAENLPLAKDVRSAVDDWDRLWLQGIGQPELMRYTRAEPYIAALQVVQVHQTPQLEFQIRDRAHHTLKALGPITSIESPSGPPLDQIRENAFSQLLDELGIPERFNLSQVATLTQNLLASVATTVELPPPPPAEGPSATPVPEAGVNASATPASLATPTPNPVQVVEQLQTVAIDAVNKNQLHSAVAVQKQLQATLDKVRTQSASKQTTELVQHLEGASAVINKAIKEKSGNGRIYIHIASESQREPARKLQERLVENNQFVVIGIQNVGGRAYIPDTTEVRFFAFPEPATTKQAADNIVGILRRNGVSKVRSRYVMSSERDTRESLDINTHFEIWFARDSFAQAD